jgi:regulator of nucleoside diphosphate kinase
LQLLKAAPRLTIPRMRQIIVTQVDAARLRSMLMNYAAASRDVEHLDELALELDRALIVAPEEVPAGVVTMRSRVSIVEESSGERRQLTLVYPLEADIAANRVSVLAPLGTALLGYREGDLVEWKMPSGLRRVRIETVSQDLSRQAPPVNGAHHASALRY